MTGDIRIICALADAAWTTRDASFDHRCSGCSKRVMLALSGQRILQANPTAKLVCAFCFLAEVQERGEPAELLAPSEDQIAELKTAIPNKWRGRN